MLKAEGNAVGAIEWNAVQGFPGVSRESLVKLGKLLKCEAAVQAAQDTTVENDAQEEMAGWRSCST